MPKTVTMINRPLFSIGFGMALALASLVPASTADEVRSAPKAVLELFTSQGCASCPPADALLTDMANSPDVIALAYHVNYWDYIGWPDTFGSQANSDRQRAYADGWGSSRIYTPQIIINGTKDVVGSRQGEVKHALQAAKLNVPVAVAIADDMLTVSVNGNAEMPATSADDKPAHAVIWLVTFKSRADISIERGENSGKTMNYTHVVTGRQALGMWEAGTDAALKLPLAEVLNDKSDGVAVLVQQERDGMPGAIIGAASLQR